MSTRSSTQMMQDKKANYGMQDIRADMQKLYDRKISPEVIETFGIQSFKDGWSYPTPENGFRWKNCNSHAQSKYAWLGKTGKATGLYYANDIVSAINAAEGVCWLVSGEPDVWAMRSAGIPHTISGFSETSPPDGLIARLREWGVEVLYIAPDKDQTGERWAKKLATLTYDTGITLICRILPDELGEGGDLGKLWQFYDQRQPFERHLSDLPKLEVKPEFAVRKKIQPRQFSWASGDVPIEYRQAVAHALGITKFDGKGWSKRIRCPMPGHKNNDAHPSAGLHEIKGLHCLAGHGWVKWKDVGQFLGLGTLKVGAAPSIKETSNCLSTEVRQAMIKSGCTSLCRALDALYENGWQPGQPFNCKDLQRCGLTNHTARKALLQAGGNERDARLLNRGRSSIGQAKELPNLSFEYFPFLS